MHVVQLIVGGFLPPVTLAILVIALTVRLRRWYRAPVGKITLYPSVKGRGEVWRRVGREVILFRSLWDADRPLWAGAWLFHVALAMVVVGHARVVTDFPRLWAALGMGTRDVDTMSATIGGALGIVILAVGLFLLGRRLFSRVAREASKLEDFGALVLLLGVILTGDLMRFATNFDLAEARAYFAGLITLSFKTMPASPLFWLHFLLVQLLLIYLPLGKLLHLPGVFFAHPLLRTE